jgi:serine/threonine protein kinase
MYGIEGLLAGRTLVDRYRIDEVIGRGGMGAVYRARDLRLNRPVAVKVISVAAPDEASHERLRARFQREARAAAALHHPNVVAVYDYGTDHDLGLDFLVMELLRGEDLAARLARKGPPAVSTALQILYQAARGLAAGHRAGLIHRDVKPGNLFLEPGDRLGELQVRVLDFGIAEIAAAEEATMTHLTVVGRSPFSPAFASPEQLLGETGITPATDVFSLGAVGFQLLTGRRAFNTSDPREQMAQVTQALHTDLPRVRGLPTSVRISLQRALARSPLDRFPNAGVFAEAIAIGMPSDPGVDLASEDPPPAEALADRTLLDTGTAAAAPPPQRAPSLPSGTRFATPAGNGAVLPGPWVVRPAPKPAAEKTSPPRPAAARVDTRPPAPASPFQPRPLPRYSWARAAGVAIWNFLLTTLSFALFAGSWFLAVAAVQEHNLEQLYVATAGTVAFTPLALHRLMGSRGSLRFTLFGSILVSIAIVYLLVGRPAQVGEPRAEVEVVLAALFMAQLLAVVFAEILTRRRNPDELDDDLIALPDRLA